MANFKFLASFDTHWLTGLGKLLKVDQNFCRLAQDLEFKNKAKLKQKVTTLHHILKLFFTWLTSSCFCDENQFQTLFLDIVKKTPPRLIHYFTFSWIILNGIDLNLDNSSIGFWHLFWVDCFTSRLCLKLRLEGTIYAQHDKISWVDAET